LYVRSRQCNRTNCDTTDVALGWRLARLRCSIRLWFVTLSGVCSRARVWCMVLFLGRLISYGDFHLPNIRPYSYVYMVRSFHLYIHRISYRILYNNILNRILYRTPGLTAGACPGTQTIYGIYGPNNIVYRTYGVL